MNPFFHNSEQNFNIISLLNTQIIIKEFHEHPLIYCYTNDRTRYGCDKCKSELLAKIPSLYCTFCDNDFCVNCFNQLEAKKINLYNLNNILLENNVPQDIVQLDWKYKINDHNHLMILIEKVNKKLGWTCQKCNTEYSNYEPFLYCSLCNCIICVKCSGIKPISIDKI